MKKLIIITTGPGQLKLPTYLQYENEIQFICIDDVMQSTQKSIDELIEEIKCSAESLTGAINKIILAAEPYNYVYKEKQITNKKNHGTRHYQRPNTRPKGNQNWKQFQPRQRCGI